MCIILVFRACTLILNVNYFTFWFSPRLHGITRELWYRHDYFSSFMLIILFERLSSLLFAWIILSQLWNTQRNYVLYEKIILLNFVGIFYLKLRILKLPCRLTILHYMFFMWCSAKFFNSETRMKYFYSLLYHWNWLLNHIV